MNKLVLPSDSNRDLYPDNKIGHYRVRFSEPVVLAGGNAEIALSAITYPTDTTSSGFYVTLPGVVKNDCSPAGSSCLRNVVVANKQTMMFTESFSKLLFMPMKSGGGVLREIEIDIKDSSTGQTVDFKGGKLVCTLLLA